MYLRLYFLLPDEQRCKQVINTLLNNGVSRKKIRAHQRNTGKQNIGDAWQRIHRAEQLEAVAWRADLVIFFLALLALAVSLWMGSILWSIVSSVILVASFLLGDLFAEFVPRVHLGEFEHALSHGEVLLMVDVDHDRVAEIEQLVHNKHPAAIPGGSSWTIQSLGM